MKNNKVVITTDEGTFIYTKTTYTLSWVVTFLLGVGVGIYLTI